MLERAEVPYLKGALRTALFPNPNGKSKGWFINDHCFIEDEMGILHFIGINNPFPPAGKALYRYHPYLGHAICNADPMSDWERKEHAIDDSGGAEYLGAPYIVKYNGQYVMLFESMLENKRHLELAYSNDLYNWERSNKPVLHDLGLGHTKRDPCIFKEGDEFLIYVNNPTKAGSKVACIRTRDFKNFSTPQNVIAIDDGVTWGGIESPFLIKRKGLYYLFICYAHRHYAETIVLVSDNPESFDLDNAVTTLYTHAPEIFSYRGKTYITSCGPEDNQMVNEHGLEIVEMGWLEQ